MIKILLLITVFCLCSCDPIYGARRYSTLEKIPHNICVKRVLERFPEVKNIRYKIDRFDNNTKGYIAGKYRTTYQYYYELSGLPINLSFEEFDDVSSPKIYSSSFGMMHQMPKQILIDKFMSASEKIEKSIGKECSVDLTTTLSNKCSKGLVC